MSNQLEIVSKNPEQTQQIGIRIGQLASPGDVFLLSGELGTGKTCLTQGIARGLGITDYALSPSFVLIREMYGRLPLYHIDLYRLEETAEIAELGLDDYLYGKGVSVIEWAERALDLLPGEHLRIVISYLGETERLLEFTPNGKRYLEVLDQLRDSISKTEKGN